MKPTVRTLTRILALATFLTGTANAETPISSVHLLDEKSIQLADAFPDLEAGGGYTFRARKILLAPGANTETASHDGAPSITYVTRGAVVEWREGTEPQPRGLHQATMDRGEVVHYWKNSGTEPAELLIVEVRRLATP